MIAALCQFPIAFRAVCRAIICPPQKPVAAARDCSRGRRVCLEKLRQEALADTTRFLNRALSGQPAR